MQIGPYTISRGAITPFKTRRQSPQKKLEAEDGTITIIEKAFNRRFYTTMFKIQRGEAEEIADWIEYGLRFSAETTTLVDHNGVSWTVRFWDKNINLDYVRGNMAEMNLLWRVESSQIS